MSISSDIPGYVSKYRNMMKHIDIDTSDPPKIT